MLDERKSIILRVLVEEYIQTGEPVSSATILERSGLQVSSATVRNDVASLESDGFVAQPHTSAGRVPTRHGYRYYVDHCSPTRLTTTTRSRIEQFFTSIHSELGRLLKETSGLLSEITAYPAVVLGPGLGTESVVGIHLLPVSSRVLMAVIVGEHGRVSQELVRLPAEPGDHDVDRAEQILERAYLGRSLAEGEHAAALAGADELESVMEVVSAVAAAIRRTELGTRELYVGGTSQLAALWHDLAHVQRILTLLEREASLRSVIEDDTPGTTVRIGEELNLRDVDLAVVSTTYEAGEHGSGRVGVLGPMRMNYRRTIKVVEEVGEGLADSLGG